MVYEVLERNQPTLKQFTPFAKAHERSAWCNLDSEWIKANTALGSSYKGFRFQSLSASDFMELSINGNRTNYEDKLFAKRKALSALVIAECLEYKGEYLTDIINGIFSICEESAWFLPAHNTYIRDELQLPLPDACNPVLELFSCETGAILATVLYLLEDELDRVSPFIAKRIRYELEKRIFEPYLNCHFWWMGNGDEPMCNWTIWCTQNVLIAAFLSGAQGNETLYKIVQKATRSTDYYLKDFKEDGCCDEGAQYYRHSGLCLYNVLDILNNVTDGQFAPLFKEPKIINIATYIVNMHVAGPYYFNFADCAPIAGRAGAREFLFAKAISNTEMMKYAANDFFEDALATDSENNLYYRLQGGFSSSEMREYVSQEPIGSESKEIFYPSTGIFITGDSLFSLAAKAGNNGDSHNHNDTGSFIVFANGLPMIIDVGVENYTKKTFSKDRYEIWTMQSAFHNLPTINGIMQKDGAKYCAKDVTYDFSKDVSAISMDLANAYPLEGKLTSYVREISLQKGKCILLHDKIDSVYSPDKIILSLMTYEQPVITDSGSVAVGNLGEIEYSGCTLSSIEECSITDSRLAITWKHSIYRMLFTFLDDNIQIRIVGSGK